MNTKAYVIIGFVLLAIVLGFVGMEWSAGNGHWNNAGDNWSR